MIGGIKFRVTLPRINFSGQMQLLEYLQLIHSSLTPETEISYVGLFRDVHNLLSRGFRSWSAIPLASDGKALLRIDPFDEKPLHSIVKGGKVLNADGSEVPVDQNQEWQATNPRTIVSVKGKSDESGPARDL